MSATSSANRRISSSARRSASTSATSTRSTRRDRSPKTISKITLLRAFDSGDFGLFFRHWTSIVTEFRQDPSILHLDFYIRVYFATQRLRDGGTKIKTEPFNKAMENFKAYLESSIGQELGKNSDLTPYFALPYVKNLDKHPLFKDLKDQKWVSLVRRKLIDFIDAKFGNQSIENGDDEKYRNGEGSSKDDAVEILQERLVQAERKLTSYRSRCTQLQMSYHRLILVAAELVDALEHTIQGSLVTPEQVEDLRSRMFETRSNNHVATSGRTISTEDEDKTDDIATGTTREAPDDPLPSKENGDLKSISEFSWENFTPAIDLSFIDWTKIRDRLALDIPADDLALLLQALRWCVTKFDNFEFSSSIVSIMVRENVLSLGKAQDASPLERMINSMSKTVQESTFRYLNTLSCFKNGRSYILKDQRFLLDTVDAIRNDRLCPNALCHALVTLQKVSVRRKVQIRLIRLNFLQWLIEYLRSRGATLSNYALEYGAALLMNLSLTTSGRKAAAEDPDLILEVLCGLMEHEDAYVISPYVNGTLFSVLSLANVRHKAKRMGLHGILDKAFQRPKTASDVRQIPYIIKQLNGELIDKQPPPSDDEYSSSVEDKSSDSEDESTLGGTVSNDQDQISEALEPELDDGDILLSEEDTSDSLTGFALLKAHYSKSIESDSEPRINVKMDSSDEPIDESLGGESTADTVGQQRRRRAQLLNRPPRRQRLTNSSEEAAAAAVGKSPSSRPSTPASRRRTIGANGTKPAEGAARPATLSSTTYYVRSADPRGRTQKVPARNSIGGLPDLGRRSSTTLAEKDLQVWSNDNALIRGWENSTSDSLMEKRATNNGGGGSQSADSLANLVLINAHSRGGSAASSSSHPLDDKKSADFIQQTNAPRLLSRQSSMSQRSNSSRSRTLVVKEDILEYS